MENNYFENEIIDLTVVDDFEGKEFVACDFKSLNLSEKSLKNTLFIECRFSKCDLSNALLQGVRFRDVSFVDCKIMGVNFSVVSLSEDLSFTDSMLDFSVFQGLDLRNFKAIDCSINDGDFAASNLEGAVFRGSRLRNTSFNECNLKKSDFTDASDYFIDPQFTRIEKAKFSMPDAMVFFEALDINVQ